jgi:hypothetical protein
MLGRTASERGAIMNARHAIDFVPVDRLRSYAALLVRAAVALLLVCAVTSAIVATGLDLLPLHP